jgi:hypothetical protein
MYDDLPIVDAHQPVQTGSDGLPPGRPPQAVADNAARFYRIEVRRPA